MTNVQCDASGYEPREIQRLQLDRHVAARERVAGGEGGRQHDQRIRHHGLRHDFAPGSYLLSVRATGGAMP